MPRRGVVLGAVLLAALPAACGRSDGEEFREDSLRPLQQRLARERARIAATLRVVRPGSERDARAVGEDVDALARTVARIDGLVPPAGAREEFDRYAAALRDLLAQLRRLPAPLRHGDDGQLTAVSQRVQDASGVVQQHADRLEEALVEL